jgi:hypothetical protein
MPLIPYGGIYDNNHRECDHGKGTCKVYDITPEEPSPYHPTNRAKILDQEEDR